MSQATVCLDTELRKLRPAELYTLGQILNVSDSWKKLMAIVPKEETSNNPKFNAEHFSMIEQAVYQQKRNAAEIFLDEWGTMGKSRPTLRTLLELLVKAELFRAADYVAADILQEELPKRPECGPAAPVDISDEAIRELLEEKAELLENTFPKSLVLGSSSEMNMNKLIYLPDKMLDAENRSSLEQNMQSTKLISTKEKFTEKVFDQSRCTIAQQKYGGALSDRSVSDLIKFSADKTNMENVYRAEYDSRIVNQNVTASVVNSNNATSACRKRENLFLPTHVNNDQEISSQELPTLLKEFGPATNETRTKREINSDDLPACLNDTISKISNVSSHTNNNSCSFMIDSAHTSNFNTNRNEMTSVEIPQCVVEIGSHTSPSNSNNRISEADKRNPSQSALTSLELPVMVLEYNG